MPSPVVLHLFSRLEPGGAELRTIQMVEALRSEPIRFVFGILSGRTGSLDDRAKQAGAGVVGMKLGPLFPFRMRRVVRFLDVNVVHAHSATASGALLGVAWMCGVPRRIAHFRSDGDDRTETLPRRVQRSIMRSLIYVFATDVVGVSPMALAFAGKWTQGSTRSRVIPSGLRVEEISSPEASDRLRRTLMPNAQATLIAHVGRDRVVKNRPRAVRILAACQESGLDTFLVMVGRLGDGEADALLTLAADLGVSERIVLCGERQDVQQLLTAADLSLVTSTREGLPGVILESCAVGTPCVASDVPGAVWIAESFDTVTTLSLQSDDLQWVDAIRKATARPVTLHERQLARDAVDRSPFAMRTAEESFARLWRGCRQ